MDPLIGQPENRDSLRSGGSGGCIGRRAFLESVPERSESVPKRSGTDASSSKPRPRRRDLTWWLTRDLTRGAHAPVSAQATRCYSAAHI
eukprot:4389475-Pyramimonas_sp.AAC.1